jgi:glycyl-tRNA synthetase beta chain
MKGDFLFEIGCEEIPAGMVDPARASLQALLEEEFAAHGLLQSEPLRTYATPRRLIATCAHLAAAEPHRVSEVVGPPQKVAYDTEGEPTRAAVSFAQRQGVAVGELKIIETPKGSYVAAVSRQKGRPTRAVLAELLPGIIPRVSFPRTMYWTSPQGLRFIRPVRWVLALWEGKVVKFSLDGVESGHVSYGHRLLANKPIRVGSLADYQRRLRQARVLIDPAERRAKILNDSDRLLRRRRLRRRADNELLELLVNLAEHPAVVLGEFNRALLSLPAEVLITVMRHHQKYFSVEDSRGGLAPHFLAVIDLDGDRSGKIRRGHEAVLAARFRDAQFFWEADQKRSLEERVALLEAATFVSGLGSYGAKVARVVALADWLGQSVSADGRHADIEALRRAARLSKSDLTTEIVGEFPELQGVIGGLYACAQGEKEEVARAVHDHYKPTGVEDSLPETLEGVLLSVADKLDTIAGCFAVGLVPSGSRDPYALRRAASGIVRLIVEKKLRLPLPAAVAEAVRIVTEDAVEVNEPGALRDALVAFLGERARHLFRELGQFPYDEVNAVFAAGWGDLVDAQARLGALRCIRPTPDFEAVAAAFKRIRNILEQAGNGEKHAARAVDETLIEAGAERELYERFRALGPEVAALRTSQRYQDGLKLAASLRPQVDRFFDKVLVMAQDEAVRANRLALLAHLLREFSTVADFSEIVITRKEKE